MRRDNECSGFLVSCVRSEADAGLRSVAVSNYRLISGCLLDVMTFDAVN
ncbi:MAG: hypothetical protein R6U00_08455 [Prochlorococcaceae cyanobacterium]